MRRKCRYITYIPLDSRGGVGISTVGEGVHVSIVVNEKRVIWSLPRERDTRWQHLAALSGDLDLDTIWPDLDTIGRVIRVEGVCLMERRDLDTEEV